VNSATRSCIPLTRDLLSALEGMPTHAVAYGPSLVTQGERLRLIASPPRQDVTVGQICHVAAKVSATQEAEVSITFPESALELISSARTIRVEPGTHEVSWTLLAGTSAVDPVLIRFEARAGNLRQFAELRMRVLADEHS